MSGRRGLCRPTAALYMGRAPGLHLVFYVCKTRRMLTEAFYRRRLRDELDARRDRNSSYSLRAFALQLGLSAGNLSRVLNGTLRLSALTAERVARKLALSPVESQAFVESVVTDPSVRERAAVKRIGATASRPRKELSLETYDLIADWYHYAILELTFVKNFRSEPRWIARQLGISVIEARRAIARLELAGLLETRDGRLVKVDDELTNRDKGLTSASVKRHLAQMQAMATEALMRQPVERRVMLGMTVPADPAKLAVARQMMNDFMHALGAFLCDGERRAVYQIGMELFPLQKEEASDA